MGALRIGGKGEASVGTADAEMPFVPGIESFGIVSSQKRAAESGDFSRIPSCFIAILNELGRKQRLPRSDSFRKHGSVAVGDGLDRNHGIHAGGAGERRAIHYI